MFPIAAPPEPPNRQRAAASSARSRARRDDAEPTPLGSLTQLRSGQGCVVCSSQRVTNLAMNLTDGTPVVFTSCHHCEAKRWDHDGETLTVTDVIERSRKLA